MAQIDQPTTSKVARIAAALGRKHNSDLPSRTLLRDSSLRTRENDFSVVEAEEPTHSNSAGIDQDGTDFSYFVEAHLGSDATPMYMLVDTGASTTWVMGSKCTSKACAVHNTFGPEDSTSLKQTGDSFSVEYGSGSVGGQMVSDSLQIAGMKVTMPFGVANETSDQFTEFPFDGILGLSGGGGDETTFLEALTEAKTVSSNVFGVSLSRSSDGPNDSEISFGAPNPARYTGDISYTSVVSKNSWAIPMDDVIVNGQSAGVKSQLAYIDTGTTYAFGPPDQVKAIYKAIPGSSSADGVTYTIPCDSKASVALTFSGTSYTVSSKDFMSSSGSGNRCPCNIFGMQVVSGWLLGDMFLKNVYTVFDVDKGRIGFASKATAKGSSTTASSPTGTPTPTVTSGNGATTLTTVTATAGSDMGLGGHQTGTMSTATAATAAATTSTVVVSSSNRHVQSRGFSVLAMCILSTIALAL
ncbi:aspartic peptidase domain-containing protein [Pseudomassariella vexata]|uniref:Aspartic peptidase domain-containing protein n=1 Tax=Pseudomassariella vexata TaxID=1141098 RepID=A0A1Y2DZP2_9PEZI|nr:aspartic peptidase domain-containing protein [Pseudomassariella vexata]ORY64095.1 aspartic peptidase domain-containing protein [Pseudomassariella vexata]